jgi:uncharacterized membrane protein
MTDIPSPPGLEGHAPEPRAVAAGRGLDWIKEGWASFKRDPGTWLGLVVAYIVINLVLGMIPLVDIVAGLLGLVWIAGFMLGCKAQEDGSGITFSHLFAGFGDRALQLLLAGLIITVVVTVLGLLVLGGSLTELATLEATGIDPATGTPLLSMSLLLRALIFAALTIPVAMAAWFAPALIAIDGLSAVDALKLSVRACLKNVMPFLVYGLIAFGLALFAAIPFGLGFLLLGPVLIAAVYWSYRDIFVH